ncbi:MAG: glycosyltransferase [Spirochaetales bacterium]|nr:glycosyltransferase [Spirochaetales bacterium]
MADNPLISIIVPVYNSEKYLSRCLDSIKAQTLSDFECLVIDDGSTDSSGSICDSYASEDSRFKVFHKENGGVSKARNLGLDHACGDYVGFVDSDDWIDDTMFDILFRNASDNGCEVSVCRCFGENSDGSGRLLNRTEAICSLFEEDGICGYSCNKLVKRDLIGVSRYNPELRYLEDTVFFHGLLKRASGVFLQNMPLYHYDKHPESVTSNYELSEIRQAGMDAVSAIAEGEPDAEIRKAIGKFLFFSYFEIAVNYVSHHNINNEAYRKIERIVREDRTWLKDYSLRRRIWRLIILRDGLKKVYWFVKRLAGK